ncbi:MAG TPA: cyclopropane-fatty-acyl-phospholipid synthase family protein [Caulobacteraceae bacterium]|jgi:cyclopropane-fatty-acyl-phospholipid synthase|nr:cyclopropane-fatty-acyl-phospholipid synthase family protein [Caulobacteraceae bacterium]
MSSVSQVPVPWTLPELKRAPAAFREFVRLAARNWTRGVLEIVTPDGLDIPIRGVDGGPEGRILVKDYRFVGRVLTGGAIGFAEGYIAGEWDTPDLAALLEALSLNLEKLKGLIEGNPLAQLANRVGHLFHRNSRAGSKRNIYAHYDLGNAFYEQWLDPSMTYSSAKYARAGQELTAAQRNKYASLARAMGLQRGQSVLEIGCGWGGFAEFAASEIGAEVTGITISQAQFDYARKRLFDKGLSEKAKIELIDYRDVEGTYDRVASIEMFEAVGEEYWPTYFRKVRDVLKPGGRAGLQIITIADDIFDRYRRSTDFIQKYIFPGGVLPSEERLKARTDEVGLAWGKIDRFAVHYADTLSAWAQRFQARWADIQPLGFDERFRRLWLFYLAYCEAGFRTGRTDVIQLDLAKA